MGKRSAIINLLIFPIIVWLGIIAAYCLPMLLNSQP